MYSVSNADTIRNSAASGESSTATVNAIMLSGNKVNAGGTTRYNGKSFGIDIALQKAKRAKDLKMEKEKDEEARKHIKIALDLINVTPHDGECDFDCNDVGIGAAMKNMTLYDKELFEDCAIQMTDFDAHSITIDSTRSRSTDSVTVTPLSRCAANAENLKKIRFRVPYHIKRRQQSKAESVDWLNARVQVSAVPVRFEIPMDVRALTGMTVKAYLARYCKIPHERMLIYKRVFKKYKLPPKNNTTMNTNDIPRAIRNLLYESVTEEEVFTFLNTLNLYTPNQETDIAHFSVIAATAERILYLSYAETAGPVPVGSLRTFIESADFGALRWRLNTVTVDSGLKRLLASLG